MPGQLVPASEFQFCGPSYLAASPVLDAQRAINLYPDPGISSSKSRMGLTGRPGLASIGVTTLGGGFGHSLFAGSGRLFVSTGTHVYEVDHAGAIITDYGTGISNAGPTPTPMVANGIQLLACDPAAGKVFNVNPGGPSLDLVFNGVALEYLDGFYLSIATGASLAGGNPNQINSSINGDGTNWPPLSYILQNGTADLPIQLAVLNSIAVVFGQKSVTFYYDAGTNVQPLARVNGGTLNLGCLSANSVVKFSNTVLWLGSDATGYGQVYMLQGMNAIRVSNAAIEQMITTMTYTQKLSSARAYGYQEAGHTFYVLNLITSSLSGLKSGMTLVYDLTTGLWHERIFAGGASALVPTHFANVPTFSGATFPTYVIDELSGQLWNSSILIANDGGTVANGGQAITYTRTAPHIGSENRWFKYPRFELDGDFGTAQPILDYSNNGGRSFLGYNYPLRQAQDQGTAGTFRRFFAMQLGRSRDRVFKSTITDDTNLIRIANAYLTAEATQ